jgi:murein L,D-transpeptidase YcbB/YkuD
MKYLIFSPYWDLTPSITRNEVLPKARRDPRYLARNNYEVVSNGGTVLGTSASAVSAVAAGRARIRQKPGPTNALGGVTFIFPNQYNVYMHDTPAQSVFARARRDASHGCIRLSRPDLMAKFLLRDQPGWDDAAITAAMHSGTPQQVNFSKPIPVHIVYASTVAREDGQVFFFEDIYGHDKTLTGLLAKGYPYATR